jgi:DNA-binding SARP family transcriptional activator/TolB-like protein
MLEIRTLGRTTISVNGVPLTGESAWPKSLALIVYMAREPGPDRREGILGVLWPDLEEKRARRALNQLLYTLRKASPELDLESISDALDFGREVWLDVDEFERRIEAGDLEGAVELYDGPFLDDLSVGEPEFDHWADRQRAGLRRKFRRAALGLAGQAKEASDPATAAAYCQRLVEVDPLDDEAQHLLIECLYLRGDRLAALRRYEHYRELLARELEVEPLDQTRELIERIRREAPPGETTPQPEDEGVAKGAGLGRVRVGADDGFEPKSAAKRWPVIELLGTRRLAGLGALFVVVVLLAVWLWPRPGAERPMVASMGETPAGLTRIAVLPFTPHGLGSDEDGMSVGVAQLLSLNLNELSAIETVAHRSVLQRWQSSERSPGSMMVPDSLRALGDALGAGALVMGDVHANGGEVRVVADVLDARTGAVLAQEHVRGPRDSLFTLLDDLALSLGGWLDAQVDSSAER